MSTKPEIATTVRVCGGCVVLRANVSERSRMRDMKVVLQQDPMRCDVYTTKQDGTQTDVLCYASYTHQRQCPVAYMCVGVSSLSGWRTTPLHRQDTQKLKCEQRCVLQVRKLSNVYNSYMSK